MVSRVLFTGLVGLVALERIIELRLSRRNVRLQLEAGGVEYGARHYPMMVTAHVGLLAGSVIECWLLDRPFVPLLGYPMLGLVILAAVGRFWVIASLGERWTTRVIYVPGTPRVTSGPYRFVNHPNYVVVVVEGVALPLVHGSWLTAVLFSIANAFLLRARIRAENSALATAVDP